MNIWETIAVEAEAESGLWAEMVLPPGVREPEAVFSTLGAPVHALGLETIYEGYLMHYGRPRLFAEGSRDRALLLGDYLYAHGLVQLAGLGQVAVVSDLAALISLCARMRADGAGDDGPLWAATAALLGDRDGLSVARETLRTTGDSAPLRALARSQAGEEAVAEALAAHQNRLG